MERWYDPSTGSWVQQDTLNAPLDPLNANRYSYANGNPVNYSDPTGQWIGTAWKIAKCTATLVVSVAATTAIIRVAAKGRTFGELARLLVSGKFKKQKLLAIAGGSLGIDQIIDNCL